MGHQINPTEEMSREAIINHRDSIVVEDENTSEQDRNDGEQRTYNFRQHQDTNEELDHVLFRYNDFNEFGKVKLAALLKAKSSIRTIVNNRDITLETIVNALENVNPKIIENWHYGGLDFSFGQLPRHKEQELSRIIYYTKIRRPNNRLKNIIIRWTKTRDSRSYRSNNFWRGYFLMSSGRTVRDLITNYFNQ